MKYLLLVLIPAGSFAPAAFAGQTAVYEATISSASQPSWTVSNGGSLMPEAYRVQVTIKTNLPMIPKSTPAEFLCGYDDERHEAKMCPETQITATIGDITERVWQKMPSGVEQLAGEFSSSLDVEHDVRPGDTLQSPVLFSKSLVLAAPFNGRNRSLDLSFGDTGVWEIPIEAQISSQQIQALDRISVPEELKLSWEVVDGMNVTYTGDVVFNRTR